MRTTLDIDDDVMAEVKDLARIRRQSIGTALSELARRGLASRPEPRTEIRNGIPVWISPPGTPPTTPEMVRAILDDEFLEDR